MKSLIWKEWRETRWIAIGFLLICLLISICWKIALPGVEHCWHAAIWSLLAVVLGARAFASEKQATTMEFLAARPLRKTHLWALKAAWGFGVLLVIVGISSVLDYLLMRVDPFYTALQLFTPFPFSWILLVLVAVYPVALLSSSVSDKTVLAVGFAIVLGAAVACVVALIARFNPNFFLLLNEPWGFPLAALWFYLVLLAGSFLIVAWRDVWPNYPTAVKRGAIGTGVGSVIVLLILSSANIPPDRITRITELEVVRGAAVVFSGEAEGKRFGVWEVNTDGEDLLKYPNPPFRERKHPALAGKGAEKLRSNMVIMPIDRGESAGGYVIEKLERDRFHLLPRRVRSTIQPIAGATLSWLGVWDKIDTDMGTFDQFYFVEELPNGERYLRVTYPEGEEAGLTGRIGRLIAVSPERESFIFVQPEDDVPEGTVRLTLAERKEGYLHRLGVNVDPEILDSLSFVTDDVVQYERAGAMYLTHPSDLAHPYLAYPRGSERTLWAKPTHLKISDRIAALGPDYLHQLAEGLSKNPWRSVIGYQEAEHVIELLSGGTAEGFPEDLVEFGMVNARNLKLLDDIAADWGTELPEELLDEAIFLIPRGFRQVIYISKEDEERSSLWKLDLWSIESTPKPDDPNGSRLIEVTPAESTKILDDIDVTAPAVPKALIAPIMEDYFVFVRDAKTIWTYRDGDLKQIFPPQM